MVLQIFDCTVTCIVFFSMRATCSIWPIFPFFYYPITSRSLEALCVRKLIHFCRESLPSLWATQHCEQQHRWRGCWWTGRFLLRLRYLMQAEGFIVITRVLFQRCEPSLYFAYRVSSVIGYTPSLLLRTVEENIQLIGTGSSAEQICKIRKGNKERNMNIKERK